MLDSATKIIEIRLGVGFLGEADQYDWWQSSFLAPSSNAFLTPVFKKTALLSKYNGVCEAARRVHDRHIGIGNVGHLFRLPEQIEFELTQRLKDTEAPETFTSALQSSEAATNALNGFCGSISEAAEGPIKMEIDDVNISLSWLKKAVSYYASAFSNSAKCYPYFSLG
jgi:hypothetical protein